MQITQDFGATVAALNRSYGFVYGANAVAAAPFTITLYFSASADNATNIYLENFNVWAVDATTYAPAAATFMGADYGRHNKLTAAMAPSTSFYNKTTKAYSGMAELSSLAPTGAVSAIVAPTPVNGALFKNPIVLRPGDYFRTIVYVPATTNLKNYQFSADAYI